MRIKPQNILCAVDFSDFTNITLSYGVALAREFGSQLYVCHIVPSQVMHYNYSHSHIDMENIAAINKDQIIFAKNRLERMVKTYDTPATIIVKSGHAADAIGQVAVDSNIDMVVAATHGRSGIKRFLIGSVTERLMKVLACPLLVLHSQRTHFVSEENHQITLKKILVGCDFSSDSELAFEYGLSLAQEFQTELHLVHVLKPASPIDEEVGGQMMFQYGDLMRWNKSDYLKKLEKDSTDPHEQKGLLIDRLERKLLNSVPEDCRNWCTPVPVFLEGEPYQEIIKYSEYKNIDLIVLGIRGHSLLEQFLIGSTTDRIIRRGKSSVLVVRGKTA